MAWPTQARSSLVDDALSRDATRPFGKPFSEVADVPGWEDFAVPELDEWR
jgi:2,5-furandicarboxylate decarboxylase 1